MHRDSGQAQIYDYTQVQHFFSPTSFSKKGFYLRALGVSAGLWLCLNFSLRNGEAKQTEPSAFRSKTEPQNRSLAGGSRHTVPALTSPKTNTLKTRPPQPGNKKKKRGRFELQKPASSLASTVSVDLSQPVFYRVLGTLESFHSPVTCVGVVPFDGMLRLSPRFVSVQDWVGNGVKRPKIAAL